MEIEPLITFSVVYVPVVAMKAKFCPEYFKFAEIKKF